MKINIKNILALMLITFLFVGCEDDEDYTGYSALHVSDYPSIQLDIPFDKEITLVENDETFSYNVKTSEKVPYDVIVKVSLDSGTATVGEDFDFSDQIIIPAGSDTGTGTITVYYDALAEDTEDFVLTIASITINGELVNSETVKFTILNYFSGDLQVSLEWNPVAYDQEGSQIDPTDIADLIFEIYAPDGTLFDSVDGGSFESYVLSESAPDGVYTIKTSYYEAMQFRNPVDIPIDLHFEQVGGLISESLSFSGITDTTDAESCGLYVTLATIEKMGSDYSFAKAFSKDIVFDMADFDGTYSGTDGSYSSNFNWLFDNPVVVSEGATKIIGLNVSWMQTIWEETPTTINDVDLVLNSDGTLSIPEQSYMITDFDGNPYEYSISGTGTYSVCDPKSLHIEYEMFNVTDGFGLGAWLFENGFSDTDYFIADIHL